MYVTKKLYETFSSKCFNLTDDYVFMKLLLNHENCPTRTVAIFKDISRTRYLKLRALQQLLTEAFAKIINGQKLLPIFAKKTPWTAKYWCKILYLRCLWEF